MSKTFLVPFLMLALVACKVEKTGKDTYTVVTPSTTNAKPAADAAEKNANKAGEEIKSGAQDLAKGVKDGWNDAAQKTKTAMESPTGQKVRAEAREIGAKVQVGVGKAAVVAGEALKDAGHKAQESAQPAPSSTSTTSTQHP